MAASTNAVDIPSVATALAIPPIGPPASADEALLCALQFGDPTGVLGLVHDDDLAQPRLTPILTVIRTLSPGTVSPQLVLDELLRQGTPRDTVQSLPPIVTAGAPAHAAPRYAAAVVAYRFRRMAESLGQAMQSVELAEADLAQLVVQAAEKCTAVAGRLAQLRVMSL